MARPPPDSGFVGCKLRGDNGLSVAESVPVWRSVLRLSDDDTRKVVAELANLSPVLALVRYMMLVRSTPSIKTVNRNAVEDGLQELSPATQDFDPEPDRPAERHAFLDSLGQVTLHARAMHAAYRYLVNHRDVTFHTLNGDPTSQRRMMFTLMAFIRDA